MNKYLLFLSCLLPFFSFAKDTNATAANVLGGLDSAKGNIQFVEFELLTEPKLNDWGRWMKDANKNELFQKSVKSQSSSQWILQSGYGTGQGAISPKGDYKNNKYGVSPNVGASCLRSNLTTYGSMALMKFKVMGGGTLHLSYRTATCQDELRVYVDSCELFTSKGYEYSEEEDEIWDQEDIDILSGLATSGTYAGTYYHEISIAIFRDQKDDLYPETPEKPEEDDDDFFWNEYYSFQGCVWVDASWEEDDTEEESTEKQSVFWTPDEIVISLPDSMDFTKSTALLLDTSEATDNGYQVRYTTDGSAPTAQSPLLDEDYLTITKTTTVTAAVFSSDANFPAPDVSAQQTYTRKAEKPTIALAEIEDQWGQFQCTISAEPEATTLYAFGAEATPNLIYSAPVPVNAGDVLNFCATLPEGIGENSTTDTFTVLGTDAPIVTTNLPDFSSSDSTIFIPNETASLRFTVTKANANQTLFYSLNGDTPKEYKTAIRITSDSTLQITAKEEGKVSCILSYNIYKADKTKTIAASGNTSFHPGWNLVALPFCPTPKSLQAISEKWAAFVLNEDTLTRLDPQSPANSFWLFLPANDNSSLSIEGATNAPVSENSGHWQIFTPDSTQSSDSAWSWDGQTFQPVTTLTPGNAYLIYLP